MQICGERAGPRDRIVEESCTSQPVDNLPSDSTASILTAGLLGEKYIGISVGGEDAVLKNGGTIHDTQSSLVLEDLIGKFLLNTVSKDAK